MKSVNTAFIICALLSVQESFGQFFVAPPHNGWHPRDPSYNSRPSSSPDFETIDRTTEGCAGEYLTEVRTIARQYSRYYDASPWFVQIGIPLNGGSPSVMVGMRVAVSNVEKEARRALEKYIPQYVLMSGETHKSYDYYISTAISDLAESGVRTTRDELARVLKSDTFKRKVCFGNTKRYSRFISALAESL